MNRDIKFRMWNKKEKKMYQVGVLDFDYNQVYMTGYLNYNKSSYLFVDVELMQFTGLHDKNGKEIYERRYSKNNTQRRNRYW